MWKRWLHHIFVDPISFSCFSNFIGKKYLNSMVVFFVEHKWLIKFFLSAWARLRRSDRSSSISCTQIHWTSSCAGGAKPRNTAWIFAKKANHKVNAFLSVKLNWKYYVDFQAKQCKQFFWTISPIHFPNIHCRII